MRTERILELKQKCDDAQRHHQEADERLRQEIRQAIREQCGRRTPEPASESWLSILVLVLRSLFLLSPLGLLFTPEKHKLAKIVLEELRQA